MNVELFLGRLQPVHQGHAQIINSMKNPVVVLVKGKASSKDKKRNPLDAQYQTVLIKRIAPKAQVVISPTGFLPKILKILRDQDMEVVKIYSGADRIAGYKAQIDKSNKWMETQGIPTYDITFAETPRVTSATAVRNAIRSNDYKEFQKLVPKVIHSEWETLKKLLVQTNESDMLSFSAWLQEQEEMEEEASAVTGDVAKTDPPLFTGKKKKNKDEKEEDDDE